MFESILYVTFDGVLEPLGFSQVVRLVAGLRDRGFRYHLLSVERTRDLADAERVAEVRSALRGIAWTPIGVDLAGSTRRSAEAMSRMTAAAFEIVRRERVSLIHARAHLGAVVALAIHRLRRVPYLFDVRGCWIEEKRNWFARPTTYAIGKLTERHLYRDAKAIVTLTELLATDVRSGIFGRNNAPIATIPPCADYDAFPLASRKELGARTTFAIVGALNDSYMVDASLQLAKKVIDKSATAHLVVLTQQRDAYSQRLRELSLLADRYTVASASHSEMATWLASIDWGLLLLHDVAAKRGSMPTKLAEFFAAGVRPIAHGCNSEMMAWVRQAGSGIALERTDSTALDEAAGQAVGTKMDYRTLEHARSITEPHFSLRSGIDRYAELLADLT